MLKDNEKNFSRLHMIIDAIVLVLSYFLAWLIRFVGPMAVASIATTSDILNVFFAMPFFVFLIFVMIIVPLWVVDRLIFD